MRLQYTINDSDISIILCSVRTVFVTLLASNFKNFENYHSSWHWTLDDFPEHKLENQELWQTLIRAFFCGILMYVAVSVYKENNTPLGIMFCIPVFILSGFEHSIADMCYFAVAGYTLPAVLFVAVVVVGNAIGGMFLPALKLIFKKKENV